MMMMMMVVVLPSSPSFSPATDYWEWQNSRTVLGSVQGPSNSLPLSFAPLIGSVYIYILLLLLFFDDDDDGGGGDGNAAAYTKRHVRSVG